VLARYETIDLANVTVNVERNGDTEVLELNVVLPDGTTVIGSSRRQPAIA